MSKKKNLKNSKNFKPQVPGKKIIEQNDEKKSGNKLKILSLAILIWSAIIYGLYIPAVSQSLQRSQESTAIPVTSQAIPGIHRPKPRSVRNRTPRLY